MWAVLRPLVIMCVSARSQTASGEIPKALIKNPPLPPPTHMKPAISHQAGAGPGPVAPKSVDKGTFQHWSHSPSCKASPVDLHWSRELLRSLPQCWEGVSYEIRRCNLPWQERQQTTTNAKTETQPSAAMTTTAPRLCFGIYFEHQSNRTSTISGLYVAALWMAI